MANSTRCSLVVSDSEVYLDSMQTHKKLPYSDNTTDAQTPSTNDTPKTVTVNIGECRCHHCHHGNHGANQSRASPFGVLKTIAVTSLVLVFLHHMIQSGGPCQCGGSKLIGMATDLSGSEGHSVANERVKGDVRDGEKDEGLKGRLTNEAASEVTSNRRGDDRVHGVREDAMSLRLREGIKNAEWNEGRSVVEGDEEDDELSEDVDLSQDVVDSGRDLTRLKRETPERKRMASDLSKLLPHHPRRKRPRGKDKDKDKERIKDKSKGKNKGKDKGKNKGKDKDRENAKSRSRRSNRRCNLRRLRREVNEMRSQIALLNDTHHNDLSEVRNVIGLMHTNQRVAIHLNYTHGHLNSLLHHDTSARSNQNGYYFIWSLHHTSPGFNYFNYTLAPSHSPFQDIYGVRVKMAGQYQIYSQLMVNGRDEENGAIAPNDCGHQTVLVTSGGVTKLLESFVTQYLLGTPYFGSGENARRPRDTPLQMGVFYLNVGDEIRVKIPDNCQHFYYRPSSHSNAAYFGLIRL